MNCLILNKLSCCSYVLIFVPLAQIYYTSCKLTHPNTIMVKVGLISKFLWKNQKRKKTSILIYKYYEIKKNYCQAFKGYNLRKNHLWKNLWRDFKTSLLVYHKLNFSKEPNYEKKILKCKIEHFNFNTICFLNLKIVKPK